MQKLYFELLHRILNSFSMQTDVLLSLVIDSFLKSCHEWICLKEIQKLLTICLSLTKGPHGTPWLNTFERALIQMLLLLQKFKQIQLLRKNIRMSVCWQSDIYFPSALSWKISELSWFTVFYISWSHLSVVYILLSTTNLWEILLWITGILA